MKNNPKSGKSRGEPDKNLPVSVMRQIREAAKMSQDDFAHYLGVTKATVSRWETHVHEPKLSFRQLKRIMILYTGLGNDPYSFPDDPFATINKK